MSAASDYLENKLLDHVLRATTYTAPADVFLSLHTGSPLDNNSGANELSGSGYARQDITFAAASGGVISNSADVVFTASGGAWSTASHWGIYDASTSGNLLFHGALGSSKTLADGDTLTFAAGDIDITCA